MSGSHVTSHGRSAVRLANLDALTTLLPHSTAIGLAALILVATAATLLVICTLSRANTRIGAIFIEELREQPDERKS
jgi:hypothetical protein